MEGIDRAEAAGRGNLGDILALRALQKPLGGLNAVERKKMRKMHLRERVEGVREIFFVISEGFRHRGERYILGIMLRKIGNDLLVQNAVRLLAFRECCIFNHVRANQVQIAAKLDETTPFAVATYIDAYATRDRKELREIPDCAALECLLNTWVEENGRNCFHMIRIDGSFRSMNVRSVPAQKEPYQRLVDVLEKQQTFFDYENIEGTIVGLYCPPYMSSLNAVGWHMHFISSDKSKGGHVLGLHIADASLSAANIRSFHLRLPKSEEFNRFDLTLDQSKDIEKIEKNAN